MNAHASRWWVIAVLWVASAGCRGSALVRSEATSSAAGAPNDASIPADAALDAPVVGIDQADGGSAPNDREAGDASVIDASAEDRWASDARPEAPVDAGPPDVVGTCPDASKYIDITWYQIGCMVDPKPCSGGWVCCYPMCRTDCYFLPWQQQPPDPSQCPFVPHCIEQALCAPNGELTWLGPDAAPH
jgi:hypothetical protein